MQSYIIEDIDSSQTFLYNIDCEGDVNLNLEAKEGKSLHSSKCASRSKGSSTNASSTYFNFPALTIEGPSFNLSAKSCRVEDAFNHILTSQEENKSVGHESVSDVSFVSSPDTTTPSFSKKKSIEEGEIVESNFLISSSEESSTLRKNKRSRDAQNPRELDNVSNGIFDENHIQGRTVTHSSPSSDSIVIDCIYSNKTKEKAEVLPPHLHGSITSSEKEISMTTSLCFAPKTKKTKNSVGNSPNFERSPRNNSSSRKKDFLKCTEQEKEDKEEAFLPKDTLKETNKKVTGNRNSHKFRKIQNFKERQNLKTNVQNTKETYFPSRNPKRIKRSLPFSEKKNNLETSASDCVSSDSDISDTDKKILRSVISNSVKSLNCVEIDQECAWKVWTLQNNLHERFPLCLKRVAEPKMSSRPLSSVRYTTSSNIVEVSPSFWTFSKRKVGMKEYNFFISLEELSKQRIMMNHPLTNASKHSNSNCCRKCGAIQSQRNEYHDCPRIRCNNCGRIGHKRNSCNEKGNKSCIPHYINNFFDEYDESLRFMMISHRRKYGIKISCIICHAGDHACCKRIN